MRLSELTQLSDLSIPESRQYAQLRDFINAGETILQNTNLDQERYQAEFSKYEAAYQDTFQNLQAIQNEISSREKEIYGGWAWRCLSLNADLYQARKIITQLRKKWEAAWQQAKIKDVLVKCDQIKVAADKILVDLDLRLQETNQLQEEFNEKYNDIEDALLSPSSYKLNQYVHGLELLDLLVKLIHENTDPNAVDWALDRASYVVTKAKWGNLSEYEVDTLITNINSGHYKRSVETSITIGEITSHGDVTIAGRDIKKPLESDDGEGI